MDVLKNDFGTSLASAPVMASSMQKSGVGATSLFGATLPPADLIPLDVFTAIVTEVNEDGSLGAYSRPFKRYVISFEPAGVRETEDLETGQGADETRPVSENWEGDLIVNAYNPVFHAMMTGKEIEVVADPLRKMTYVTISEITPDAEYGVTFATGEEPIPLTVGKKDYDIILTDAKGNSLQAATAADATGANITEGEYIYDAKTRKLLVNKAHVGTNLDVIFYIAGSSSLKISASETLRSKIFRLEILSTMQSASTGSLWTRQQVISRATLSGDAPEVPTQKDINTNMPYPITSLAPAAGERPYVEMIYPQQA